MNAQEKIDFKVIGGYQFVGGYTIQQNNPFIFAQAGQLTGSWHWEFDNGQKGNTHINGATANRVLAGTGKNELFGTMQINMYELEGTPMGQDLLYLAYTSRVFELEGSSVKIEVDGEFIGGTGKYKNASGHLNLTSINGFFEDGGGTIYLNEQQEITKETVTGWVNDYFKATQSGNASTWADSFADNVYLNDPYGSESPRNREEIATIGETFMSSFESVGLYPDFIYVKWLEATVKWTGRGITKDGKEVTFQGINMTTYNREGKIISHIGYWDPQDMVTK
ncbi:MAG: nuclear transport factor 2 family protein [Bacteroidota bacterium]